MARLRDVVALRDAKKFTPDEENHRAPPSAPARSLSVCGMVGTPLSPMSVNWNGKSPGSLGRRGSCPENFAPKTPEILNKAPAGKRFHRRAVCAMVDPDFVPGETFLSSTNC